MKSVTLLGAILAVAVDAAPTVDELYPYTGPNVPVGDWIDPTVKGNGKGFVRLVEPPAVKPASANPTNNVNVISVSYIPNGINIHYQTPFGLGESPSVIWGSSPSDLINTATGQSVTYVTFTCPYPIIRVANEPPQIRPYPSLLFRCDHPVQRVLP